MEIPQEATHVDEIISETEKILAQASARSIEELRSFVVLQPDEGEIFACFELFHGQDYGMNYNKFFPKKPGSLSNMDVVWGPIDESNECFLPELRDFEEELYSYADLSEAEVIEWTKKSEELLAKWFSQCWIAAGGKGSTIPTYFCFEKEYMCRDMLTGEIITEEEAARRAGYTAI